MPKFSWQAGLIFGLCAKILVALWDDGFHCGDIVLWSRVRALEDEGVFEMKDDGTLMHESSVRLRQGAV
ncbi:hypothetical protein [Mesorhizobium sp. B2-7-1]|uniref:hypothetical protein n=1 Tax=Mesorhizobium sp. B2-7-1 TaxID=2589909 RepID=UPI00112A7FCF|nr:hypothetical protein [Mesorhizobium sp. B2-7-1]TPJ52001.1 hypothetical protein FJ471_28460 [Mesorhizobium sp. B2-7-1]